MKVTVISMVVGARGTVPKGSEKKKSGRSYVKKMNKNYSDDSIIKIDSYTQKNPGDMKRVAFT